MKKNCTELVYIIDRSGSMEGLEKDTIGGFNAMMKEQATKEGEVLVSCVLFDDQQDVIFDRMPLDEKVRLNRKNYFVRGCTALLDAVGGAIHHISTVHKYIREEDRPEHTIVIITTDGMENASRYYSYDTIEKMIQEKKEKFGWEFLFVGANIDAIEEASKFGITPDRASNYVHDEEGTKLNYQAMDIAVTCFRENNPLGAEWKTEVERDYKRRGKR